MNAWQTFVPPSVKPGPDNPGYVRFLTEMIRNPLSAIPEAAYREPVTVIKLPGGSVGIVSDPDMVEEILVRRPQFFPKSKIDDRVFKPALGRGLLTADGDDWKWKRRLMAPYFSPARLKGTVPCMAEPFTRLAVDWGARNETSPVDISAVMTSATFDVITRTLFSNQDEVHFDILSRAIEEYLRPITWVIGYSSLRLPSWLPYPGAAMLRRARDRMRAEVGELIAARRKAPVASDDICGDLMRAKDPDSGRMLSDADLVDMLLTLIAAGHETSANGLSWALYCLANLPDLQEQIAAEVADVTSGATVSPDDISKLRLTDAFLKEAMRLFPPAPMMARRTVQTEEFGGYNFASDTELFIPIYAIHRHERLWENAHEFRIERFLNDGQHAIARMAYMPFGGGPRVCLGRAFAMQEMLVAFAVLLQRLRFSLSEETRCEPVHRITMRSRHPMRLVVRLA
jgi:cytochrome P450